MWILWGFLLKYCGKFASLKRVRIIHSCLRCWNCGNDVFCHCFPVQKASYHRAMQFFRTSIMGGIFFASSRHRKCYCMRIKRGYAGGFCKAKQVALGKESFLHYIFYCFDLRIFRHFLCGLERHISSFSGSFCRNRKQPLKWKELAPFFITVVRILALEQHIQNVSRGVYQRPFLHNFHRGRAFSLQRKNKRLKCRKITTLWHSERFN